MTPASPQPVLGVRHAIAIVVGIVIGAGIFKAPSLVAQMTGSPGWMFAAWALGGLASLAGALCYAELATTYPHAGGDYHFLWRAYGRRVSFADVETTMRNAHVLGDQVHFSFTDAEGALRTVDARIEPTRMIGAVSTSGGEVEPFLAERVGDTPPIEGSSPMTPDEIRSDS